MRNIQRNSALIDPDLVPGNHESTNYFFDASAGGTVSRKILTAASLPTQERNGEGSQGLLAQVDMCSRAHEYKNFIRITVPPNPGPRRQRSLIPFSQAAAIS